jgi:hypothetical protein
MINAPHPVVDTLYFAVDDLDLVLDTRYADLDLVLDTHYADLDLILDTLDADLNLDTPTTSTPSNLSSTTFTLSSIPRVIVRASAAAIRASSCVNLSNRCSASSTSFLPNSFLKYLSA